MIYTCDQFAGGMARSPSERTRLITLMEDARGWIQEYLRVDVFKSIMHVNVASRLCLTAQCEYYTGLGLGLGRQNNGCRVDKDPKSLLGAVPRPRQTSRSHSMSGSICTKELIFCVAAFIRMHAKLRKIVISEEEKTRE